MTISKAEIEKIMKTLPIGYYAKHDIKLELQETGGSYFDMINEEIKIGLDDINEALKNTTELQNVEQTIRGLLYHEVSHALLTPKTLEISDVVNIFEDERIESIFRNYYIGVNFRKLVFDINNFHNEKPKDAMDEFYQTVRFRIGKQEYLDDVHHIITRYKLLNCDSDRWASVHYKDEIENLFQKICNDWNMKQNQQNSQSSEQNQQSEQSEQNESIKDGNFPEQNSEDKKQDNNQEGREIPQIDNRQDFSDKIYTDETIPDLSKSIENLTNKFIDNNMLNDCNQILSKLTFMKKRNGSAINAYSGIFDIRSTIRDDYKFFIQKNRLGNCKGFSKFHLNLFIDKSGSFWESEEKVNKLLFALSQYEKQNSDFKLDVVFCGNGQTVTKRNERQLHCKGSNLLTEDIYNQFNTLQLSDYVNYNIVLFDGDAFSGYKYNDYTIPASNFRAFNHSNVTLISDSQNTSYIESFCKLSKRIYTNNYAEEFIKNVFQVLLTSVR